jgi:hypothetical protein
VVFVTDDLMAWLVGLLADAGRKKLAKLTLGSVPERAMRRRPPPLSRARPLRCAHLAVSRLGRSRWSLTRSSARQCHLYR